MTILSEMYALMGEELAESQAVVELEDILGCVWLYIDWRYVTKQLSTEQKERFADAVDASSARLNGGTTDRVADRWWLA